MQLFDTHCHLDFEVFNRDRNEVVERARAQGIEQFMLLGVTCEQWAQLPRVASEIGSAYYSFGLHPYFIEKHQPEHLETLKQQLLEHGSDGRLRAIGEIGLDAECGHMERQQQLLREQLRLAREHQLPVILHHRKTLDKLLKMVRESGPQRGVVHAFSGSYEQGKAWVEQGYYLGIGGTITYPRAKKTRDAVARLPLDAMVLETDCPDMPVCGHQGERNEPARLRQVLSALASITSLSEKDVAERTYRNSLALFGLNR